MLDDVCAVVVVICDRSGDVDYQFEVVSNVYCVAVMDKHLTVVHVHLL